AARVAHPGSGPPGAPFAGGLDFGAGGGTRGAGCPAGGCPDGPGLRTTVPGVADFGAAGADWPDCPGGARGAGCPAGDCPDGPDFGTAVPGVADFGAAEAGGEAAGGSGLDGSLVKSGGLLPGAPSPKL